MLDIIGAALMTGSVSPSHCQIIIVEQHVLYRQTAVISIKGYHSLLTTDRQTDRTAAVCVWHHLSENTQ